MSKLPELTVNDCNLNTDKDFWFLTFSFNRRDESV